MKCVKTIKNHNDFVNCVAFSPDGNYLVSCSDDCTVQVCDTKTFSILKTFDCDAHSPYCVAFSNLGDRFAVCTSRHRVSMFSANLWNEMWEVKEAHTDLIVRVAFSPNDEKLASASWDSHIKIWNSSTGQVLQTINNNAFVYDVVFLSNTKLLSWTQPYSVNIVDLSSWTNTSVIFYTTTCSFILVLRLSNSFVLCQRDGIVELYDSDNYKIMKTFNINSLDGYTLAFSSDEKYFAYFERGIRDIFLYSVAEETNVRTVTCSHRNLCLNFSPCNKILSTGTFEGFVNFWKFLDEEWIARLSLVLFATDLALYVILDIVNFQLAMQNKISFQAESNFMHFDKVQLLEKVFQFAMILQNV